MLYDAAFQPIVDRMRDKWPGVEHYICFDSGEHAPAFEDWIGAQDGVFEWVGGDERDPCMICYTSGCHGQSQGRASTNAARCCMRWPGLQPSTFNSTKPSNT